MDVSIFADPGGLAGSMKRQLQIPWTDGTITAARGGK
jgi:hypothetical protein